ncbi:MAG: hypothetical protein OXC07_10130 [Kistimonas sp.]|nr:hypothetical protein [Kistimonas sp.]
MSGKPGRLPTETTCSAKGASDDNETELSGAPLVDAAAGFAIWVKECEEDSILEMVPGLEKLYNK